MRSRLTAESIGGERRNVSGREPLKKG